MVRLRPASAEPLFTPTTSLQATDGFPGTADELPAILIPRPAKSSIKELRGEASTDRPEAGSTLLKGLSPQVHPVLNYCVMEMHRKPSPHSLARRSLHYSSNVLKLCLLLILKRGLC